MMQKIFLILVTFLSFVSCKEPIPEKVDLSIDVNEVSFPIEGGVKTLNVMAEDLPEVSCDEPWCDVTSQRTLIYNEFKVIVQVARNINEPREAKIVVKCNGQSETVEVVQEGFELPEGEEPETDEPEIFLGMEIPKRQNITSWNIAKRLGLGFNLGNQMDAHSDGIANETCWGNSPATQQTFNKIKAAGFTSVRIPVTWLGHIGPAPDYKVDEAWMARVVELVSYAEKAELNAIVNIHHDGANSEHWLDIINAASDPECHQEILLQIEAVWTQIATAMKDFDNFLIFESFNEIHDGGWGWGQNLKDGGKQYRCLNEWNGAFVKAVRAVGGNNTTRLLGIPGYCTNPDLTLKYLQLPSDVSSDYVMISVHCYDPHLYTLEAQYSEWGHTAAADKKPAGDNEKDLLKVFKALYDGYVSKGIPVYLGEFGCVNRSTERQREFQRYYLEYYGKLAKSFGIPAFIWDNGAKGAGREKHAFIDHGTGEYCSQEAEAAIDALMKGYWTLNPSYKLESVYNSAPK